MGDDAAATAPFLVVDEEPPKKDLKPVYSAISTDKKRGNLTCSGTNEFCFLCSYMSTEDCEVDLRAHISELAERGSEVVTIARAVHSIYNSAIRPTLVHVDDDGTKHTSPEWTLDSIKKHLLLSGEYEGIFSSYERYVLKSLILRQAESIMDETGAVDDGRAKQLLASIKLFSEYRAKSCPPAAKRQRVGINSTPS